MSGGIHQANGGVVTGLATTFETLKAATPTPAEVAANRATDVVLQSTNFLGFNTPKIVANNATYVGKMWVPAAANMVAWNTTAEAAVGSMPPLPPAPIMTTNPGVGEPPATQTVSNAATKTAGGLGQSGSSAQMFSGLTSVLPSLAQAPMALMQAPAAVLQLPAQLGSQLMSGPMQLSGMLSSMIQNKGIGVGSGALGGSPLESSVKATTSGGGAGVGAGGGAALRTPVALSATPAGGINAAAVVPPRDSKIQAARTTGVGATTGGSLGAVPMSALHRGGGGADEQGSSSRTATNRLQLSAASHIPIITGSGAVPAGSDVSPAQNGSHDEGPTSVDQVWRQLATKV
ncbi:PPE-repeat protein [Tsukamurella ocularis]|nr:PPE-repeat protein [Tsukamurella ocularis]